MRLSRFAPAVAAVALLAAGVAPAHAQTDEAPDPLGVANSTGTLTALRVQAGSLLSLDLLTDAALANTDTGRGTPMAAAQLLALTVDSPALGVSETIPLVEVQSTGEEASQSQEVDVVDNPVVDATVLPVMLRALLSGGVATSEISAGVTDLDVLGGLARVASTQVGLGSDATGAQSAGLRGVDIDAISVLDLEALLAGLGIPLADLPLDTVLGLVDSLGLMPELAAALEAAGVTGFPSTLTPESLGAFAGTLADEVVTLSGFESELIADNPVCDVTAPAADLLGQLTGQDTATICDDVSQTAADTTDALLALTGQLGAVLNAPLALLAGQPLLSLEGIDVSVVTTATDSVETSVADVTAVLGAITAAGLSLEGVDLLGTVDQVNGVLGQAQGAIGGLLAGIDPRLADLITISALQETSSVVADGDRAVTSSVDFVGLAISVNPDLEALLAIITEAASLESIGDQLTGLGLPVPGAPAGIGDLNALLAGVPTSGLLDDTGVFALTEGLTIEVASISQSSSFAGGVTVAATPEIPALPTTGSQNTLFLLGAGLAVAAAAVARRKAHSVA